VPGVRFTHVTYLNDRTLLTADYCRRGTSVRLWDLAGDAPPRVVPWPQARAVLQLFKPCAGPFLRRQGLWRDGEELPQAFSDDPNWFPPALQPVPHCDGFFHPDGVTAAFCETVPGRYYYSRFLRERIIQREPTAVGDVRPSVKEGTRRPMKWTARPAAELFR
jgi:hypothetical protein